MRETQKVVFTPASLSILEQFITFLMTETPNQEQMRQKEASITETL